MAKPRKSQDRFRDLIGAAAELESPLPLVHVTDAYRFTELTDSTQLTPVHCKVFGEPLVYLFYGRPAYRTKRSGPLPLAYDLPIALVFKTSFTLEYIRRVFPFDTGAYDNGLYQRFFHPDTKLEDFELDPNLASARKLLGFYYRSVEEYLTGRSTTNVDLPLTAFEAQGVHELARASAHPTASGVIDERSSSVEIQTSRSVPLRGNVLAVVLPNILLNDEDVRKFLQEIGGETITYESVSANSSESYATVIYDKVISLYRSCGIIK